ncbi:hypothetical protein AAES_81624 [Amazona aestiva]|uniref:Uncharacterized protein n=1 Tax=Amazona aestiva TaxID=12930 RepID=A0A0Q3USS7_AMAAE|nr:hypothetical protein AAES_81624 [Amazona aestiva]
MEGGGGGPAGIGLGDDLSGIVLGMATGTCFVDSGVCAVNQEKDDTMFNGSLATFSRRINTPALLLP